jgi:hypothetical protein
MKKISNQNKLTEDILKITAAIQKDTPSLYAILNETPLHINYKNNTISKEEYIAYLQTITIQQQEVGIKNI